MGEIEKCPEKANQDKSTRTEARLKQLTTTVYDDVHEIKDSISSLEGSGNKPEVNQGQPEVNQEQYQTNHTSGKAKNKTEEKHKTKKKSIVSRLNELEKNQDNCIYYSLSVSLGLHLLCLGITVCIGLFCKSKKHNKKDNIRLEERQKERNPHYQRVNRQEERVSAIEVRKVQRHHAQKNPRK